LARRSGETSIRREPRFNGVPLFPGFAVEARRADPDPFGRFHLVAHQRQERAYEQRGACALLAQDLAGDGVDEALAPAGALELEDLLSLLDPPAPTLTEHLLEDDDAIVRGAWEDGKI
jgi:hypothetical protein